MTREARVHIEASYPSPGASRLYRTVYGRNYHRP